MKTLGKLLTLGTVSLIGLGTPNLANAQYEHIKINNDPSYVQKIKDFWSNPEYKSYVFINSESTFKTKDVFETFPTFEDFPCPSTFYKVLGATLNQFGGPTVSSKDEIAFIAMDKDNDGSYDFMFVQTSAFPLTVFEQFNFNKNSKTLDYYIGFYPPTYAMPERRDVIIEKIYKNITQSEAKTLGPDFIKRINDLTTIPDKTSRFSKEEFDIFLRDERAFWTFGKNGYGNVSLLRTGVPLNKIFSKEELEKLDDYIGNNEK